MSGVPRLDLRALLAPRSIAIIGASPGAGNGFNALKNLQEMRFEGDFWAVNPKYDEVLGVPCFPSVNECPHVPEAVYIGVGAPRAVAELERCATAGVRAAVVHAGGFSESGEPGARLERELREIAERTGMTLCGPNTLGVLTPRARAGLFGASLPSELRAGNIGAVFQSGSVLLALMNSGRGLGFSQLISTGNEAGTDFTAYVDHLLDDEQTRVVIGYVEGLRQPAELLRVAAKAQALRKPLILLKPGRTEAGARAALAHTGALAGSDQVLTAVFRKYGVIRAHDLDELIELSVLFSRLADRAPASHGMALSCVSGGELGIVVDLASDLRLRFADLSPQTGDALRRLLPAHVQVTNPLDMTATGLYEPELYGSALKTLASDPSVGLIAVAQDFPDGMGAVQAARYRTAAKALAQSAATIDKPVVFFSNLSGGLDHDVRRTLDEAGIAMLLGARESLGAIASYLRFHHLLPLTQEPAHGPTTRAGSEEALAADADRITLDEVASRALLRRFDIPFAEDALATSPEAVRAAAEEIGFPVVLKVVSADLPHKSEAGGVELGIGNADEAAQACTRLLERVRSRAPCAHIAGVSVQRQIPPGVEVIAGIQHDEQFGPVVVVGIGGIFVEVLRDSALALAPVSFDEAQLMILSLRGVGLLQGARGTVPRDVDALARLLVDLSRFADQHRDDVLAVDLNPVVVHESGHGVTALDALVVCRKGSRVHRLAQPAASGCQPDWVSA